MVFVPRHRSEYSVVAALMRARLLPNFYDVAVFAIVLAAIILFEGDEERT